MIATDTIAVATLIVESDNDACDGGVNQWCEAVNKVLGTNEGSTENCKICPLSNRRTVG